MLSKDSGGCCEVVFYRLTTVTHSSSIRYKEAWKMKKDLLSIADLRRKEIEGLIEQARRMKHEGPTPLLLGRTLALLFEKPSLRTRVSFEMAMYQLGGHSIYLSPQEVGLGKREGAADVARVLSRYIDGIAARTFSHETLRILAGNSSV